MLDCCIKIHNSLAWWLPWMLLSNSRWYKLLKLKYAKLKKNSLEYAIILYDCLFEEVHDWLVNCSQTIWRKGNVEMFTVGLFSAHGKFCVIYVLWEYEDVEIWRCEYGCNTKVELRCTIKCIQNSTSQTTNY